MLVIKREARAKMQKAAKIEAKPGKNMERLFDPVGRSICIWL